jgi:hypothetical protein
MSFMLNVGMLSVIYAECRYAECRGALAVDFKVQQTKFATTDTAQADVTVDCKRWLSLS